MLRAYGSRYTTTPDGAELWFATLGEGELTCILCDGLGCDGFAWKYLAPALAKQHRVLRFHYRGHGKSSMPRDPTRLGVGFAADDLAQVMNEAGVEKGVLFGHSMGVQVTLEMHRRHPERVSGLVPICGSYGNPLDTFHDETFLRRVFPYIHQLVDRFPTAARRLTHWALSTELAVRIALEVELNKELVRRADVLPYFQHLAKMDPTVFVKTLESQAEHTGWDHLPDIDVPTRVIGGDRDTFTPLWLSRRMADAIPGSEMMIVPGGSHTAPLEQPTMVNERLHRFLDQRIEPLLRQKPAAAPAEKVAS